MVGAVTLALVILFVSVAAKPAIVLRFAELMVARTRKQVEREEDGQ